MSNRLFIQACAVFVAAIIGWEMLNAYGGVLFLLCLAVAIWRLWRVDAGHNRLLHRFHQMDADRPEGAVPAVLPNVRGPRSLDRALAELDGMIGLAAVKAEVRTWIDVLAAERERSRFGHTPEPPALHCVFRKRGKSPGGDAIFSCADSAAWILYLMCRRQPPFPV